MTYYVIHNPDSEESFLSCNDEGVPTPFDTEEAAIDDAKLLSTALVVRVVAKVTQKPVSYKVERIK